MVFTVTTKTTLDTAALQSFLRTLNDACHTTVAVGVLNGDKETRDKAEKNEIGGWDTYDRGPYEGEKVLVPPRPFIGSSIEHHAEEIRDVAGESLDFEKDPNLVHALTAVGKKVKEIQEHTLESNGEGVPNWKKHNTTRTIETKNGLDKPLFTEAGTTFPIDYELQKRSA